jgi:hypothetical protein
MSLDIKRAFQNSFRGDRWIEKILIGSVIMLAVSAVSLIPQIGWLFKLLLASITLGYSVRVMRQESNASPTALPTAIPEWSDWSGLVQDGLLLTAANMIYAFVLGGLFIISTAVLGASALLSEAMAGQAVTVPGAVLAVWVMFALAAFFLFVLFVPLMSAHYAHKQSFVACFEVGTIVSKLAANPGNVILAVLSLIGLTILAGLLSFTIILQPTAAFLAHVIAASIWAQVYRTAA